MGEVLKFVTLDGGFRKKRKKSFCTTYLKRAQHKHKKHCWSQAKLLDVLSNDILQKAKK